MFDKQTELIQHCSWTKIIKDHQEFSNQTTKVHLKAPVVALQ